jgi:RimJ/RimL family protein N-acetyltransferase
MTFDTGITLWTERLTLRPFGASDIGTILEVVQDAEMLRWMAWAPEQTPERARAWCTVYAHEDPEHQITFAVEGESGRCDGSVALSRAVFDGGRAEIGYWIAPWARRRGYGTEAVCAVAAYAFRKGLHRLELLAATGNIASQGLALKAGFTREGTMREALVTPGGRVDAVLFGLLKGDL